MVKEFLSDHNVAFETKDVSTDEQARDELINKYESMSTPTVVIDGEVLVGFNPDKMAEMLNLE